MMDIDFNLLRIFEILYDERHVTRAAARLFLTQSAVSHALGRLRDALDDPLFIRIPSGLRPTERAHQLAPRLLAALAEIRGAVAAPRFDPAIRASASSFRPRLVERVSSGVLHRSGTPH